jgi:threonine aldolase
MLPFRLSESVAVTRQLQRQLQYHKRILKKAPSCQSSQHRQITIKTTTSSSNRIIDLRSDTVTQPSPSMLHAATLAPTGDDVMNEDPTVLALQEYVADLFGKEAALYVPTGTMGNLCAILAHCHYNKSAEMILGSHSHINLYEGGGYANIAGVSAKMVKEDENAMLNVDDIMDAFRADNDDHYAKTTLICLENTHNMLGGVALSPEYIDRIGMLAHETWEQHGVKVHIDGARIMNSAISQSVSPSTLCKGADSVSICLSKGLGAPLGSVLVGEKEFIRLAKRARKRLGGGMRQAGVTAAMGMYALQNNVERLAEDHENAQTMARELKNAGFWLPRNGQVDTNVVFFGLPEKSKLTKEQLTPAMYEKFGIKISGGYSSGGKLFRLVTHMDVDAAGVDTTVSNSIDF